MITGIRNVHPLAALWLLKDDYDHNPSSGHISATGLLKPLQASVLTRRNPDLKSTTHLTSLTASRTGTAIHDAIERTWLEAPEELIKQLGQEDLVVNPTVSVDPLNELHLEQRVARTLEGVTISGKFDAIYRGQITDIKSCKTYNYTSGSSDDDYIAQLSIYRWLNPQLAVKDTGIILYVFKDWVQRDTSQAGYPTFPVMHKEFRLWSLAKTEQWIRSRLATYRELVENPEQEPPECTDTELWRGPTVYKYYATGKITARSTRTFTSAAEAMQYTAAKGSSKGITVTVPGKVGRCNWCPAVNVCPQAKRLLATGELVVPELEKLLKLK